VLGRTTLHSTIPGRRWKRNLRVVAIVSAVAVVAGLAALWVVRARKAGEPLPVGIPMQITSGEGWEGEPAISPDGTRVAYVSNESGNDDVYVADVLGGRVLQLTTDPGMDFAPAWFPDGMAIAFVSDRTGTPSVWRVGRLGGEAVMLLEDAEYPAISPDGTRIAVSRSAESVFHRIWVASLEDMSDAMQLTTGEHGLLDHRHAAWSPDGRMLCYSTLNGLFIVDVDGGTPRLVAGGRQPDDRPAWSSDGSHVYFESWREGTLALWRVGRSGDAPQRMTVGAAYEGEPSVSADGARFAYSSGSASFGTVITDLTTGHEITLGRMRTESTPILAPDGGRVIYVSRRWDGRGELAEQPLARAVPSGPPKRLTDQVGTASHPACSPDGKWVAYYLILGDERDIWIVPSRGGPPLRFTESAALNIHPSWSPDGRQLAFVSNRAGSYDVWVAPVSTGMPAGEARRLTDGSVAAFAPVWSPDGSQLAFVGSAEGQLDVWLVSEDGRAAAERLTEGIDVTRIRWDGTRGLILAAATLQGDRRLVWAVSPETGDVTPFVPEVALGSAKSPGLFDLSRDGRLLLFSRENQTGDIWVSEGPPGTY